MVLSCLYSLISACSASGEDRVSPVMQPMDLTLLTAAARPTGARGLNNTSRPALPLGLRVLNRPLGDLKLPLVGVGIHSVHLVLEAEEARLAVIHESDDLCAVLLLSLHPPLLTVKTGGIELLPSDASFKKLF
mgnify:CR=1 FL=1